MLGLLAFFMALVVLSFFGSVLLNIVDAVFVCYALDRDTQTVTQPEVHEVFSQVSSADGRQDRNHAAVVELHLLHDLGGLQRVWGQRLVKRSSQEEEVQGYILGRCQGLFTSTIMACIRLKVSRIACQTGMSPVILAVSLQCIGIQSYW